MDDGIVELLACRKATHGDFAETAALSQSLKRIFWAAPNWPNLNDQQREALEQIALKLGRLLCGDPNHPDHAVDIAGYALLLLG
jgi:hypothetical protein